MTRNRQSEIAKLARSQKADDERQSLRHDARCVRQTDLRASAARSHDPAIARRDVIDSAAEPGRYPDPAEIDWDDPAPKILEGMGHPWGAAEVGFPFDTTPEGVQAIRSVCPGCDSARGPKTGRVCVVCHAKRVRDKGVRIQPMQEVGYLLTLRKLAPNPLRGRVQTMKARPLKQSRA